jgi:hypothetical protein
MRRASGCVYCRFFDAPVGTVRSITASAEERQYSEKKPLRCVEQTSRTAVIVRKPRRHSSFCESREDILDVVIVSRSFRLPRPHVIAAIMKQALVPLRREAAEFAIRVSPIVFSAILALFSL